MITPTTTIIINNNNINLNLETFCQGVTYEYRILLGLLLSLVLKFDHFLSFFKSGLGI